MTLQPVLSVKPVDSALVAVVNFKELDLDTTQQLKGELDSVLASEPTFSIVLDMSQLEFVPSMAMGVLVKLHKDLLAQGRKIVLAAPTPFVLESMQVTALDRYLTIRPNIEDALAVLAS